MIDWTNGAAKVSRYFRVREAITLRRWKRLATESDGLNDDVKASIVAIFSVMDQVRDILGVPLIVHDAFRPEKYNVLVNGSITSYHKARLVLIDGKKHFVGAVDFHPEYPGLTIAQSCDKAKEILRPQLEKLGLRMEMNGPGSEWIHLDNGPVPNGGHREFVPAQ